MKILRLSVLLFLTFLFFGCDNGDNGLGGDLEPSVDEVFNNLTYSDISTLSNSFSNERINSTHGSENEMPTDTIILFQSSDGNLGKMLVTDNTNKVYSMGFEYVIYYDNGAILLDSEASTVDNTWTFDFETNSQDSGTSDFWWEWTEFHGGGQPGDPIYLTPLNQSLFIIYDY